ncbi:MAG TPA: hypothetical protein VKV24_08085, partial [Casimicrobiaceae bacterium]|nr:hypothetical protein [Casimicrobiaceae bacterium]
KALLYQQTNCLPTDPLNISPRRSQMTVLSPTEYIYTVDRLKSVRGVNGWYNVSCVVNGDDAIPGTPDNRNSEMAPLGLPGADIMPFPVTINALYLADPT